MTERSRFERATNEMLAKTKKCQAMTGDRESILFSGMRANLYLPHPIYIDSGEGATITTDVEGIDRGVSALVQAALRHGGLDEVEVVVRGTVIEVSPITDSSGQVVLGQELRDLGAAVAVTLIEFLGGAVDVEDGTLTIALAG